MVRTRKAPRGNGVDYLRHLFTRRNQQLAPNSPTSGALFGLSGPPSKAAQYYISGIRYRGGGRVARPYYGKLV